MTQQITEQQQGYIEGTWIRGGTSNGLFVTKDQIPSDEKRLDELLLELFGSPDPLQINGIGGSKSHTSKFMAIERSDRDGVDVDYSYGQVSVNEPTVDRSGNCGNLTSAIGVAALLEGVVEPSEPVTQLTLFNTNTETIIEQEIPIIEGEPAVYGEYSIDGVPGTGAKITSRFQEPAESVTGSLFPTGNRVDTISLGDSEIEATVIDATNVNVFVRAEDVGFEGTELPDNIDGTDELDLLNEVRASAANLAGFDGYPGIAFVSEPQSYETTGGENVSESDIDITARYISLQPHHAYAMTGAMALGAATQLEGTIPNEAFEDRTASEGITIGHPKGDIAVDVEVTDEDHVREITNFRTARPISRNKVFYRRKQVE